MSNNNIELVNDEKPDNRQIAPENGKTAPGPKNPASDICEIDGCTNPSWRKCDHTLDWPMFFGWLWKSCGLRICKQHTKKSGCTQLNHCTSATPKKTPCEVQFQKGVIAQNLIIFVPFIVIGIIFLNWVNTAYGRGYFGTMRYTSRYKMTKDPETNYIYLDPLGDHESTVIFLHGL